MIIYICLETILQNPEIIPKIKKLYEDGDTITIACTLNFREKNEREDIEKMLEPLKNCYHKNSGLHLQVWSYILKIFPMNLLCFYL